MHIHFGKTAEQADVELYTLTNPNGLVAKVITLGATLTELWVPDRDGHVEDVVLGFDSLAQYEDNPAHLGSTTGRVANRIAGGRFTLNGVEYRLATNNGPHHLHGGIRALHHVVWAAAEVDRDDGVAVRFTYLSPDGEEGYPGNLDIAVTYILTHDNALRLEYQATTDRPTPVNLTHHSYFNLGGAGSGDVLAHHLRIAAASYTPVDEELIPTGQVAPVAGTMMDFRDTKPIGMHIAETSGGYDNNYVLDRNTAGELALAAEAYDPVSGRAMTVQTTEPGLQLYTANFLDGTLIGKAGRAYHRHWAFCLETQHFPDSVNQPSFPSIVLHPGEQYRQITAYRFASR